MLMLKAGYTSRLKERLLSLLPDLQAHSQGKCIILTFDYNIGSALRKVCNIDDDVMHLVRAAQILHQEKDGSFKPSCEQDVI